METAVVLAWISLIGTTLTAVITLFSKKFKTPADQLEVKKLEKTADEALLDRFERLLSESDARHKADRETMEQRHQGEINSLNQKYNALEQRMMGMDEKYSIVVRFVYHLLGILRRHDLMDEITEKAPEGIYVS